ncbi:MAG TPA: hypothetical protein VN694_06880 [Caulobacteraceae bacterium]|nr:hypothetical protein [Caulobacteraceae bacterium]
MSSDTVATLTASPAVQMRAPKHALPLGAPCPNCGTALAGPWRPACGQSSDDFHRSLRKLTAEAAEGPMAGSQLTGWFGWLLLSGLVEVGQ